MGRPEAAGPGAGRTRGGAGLLMRALRDRLADIRAAAADILAFLQGRDESAFAALPETDRRTYRAIKNALAEIGEAIKQLPPEVLAAHREIDWRGVAGPRDGVGHPNFSVQVPPLWPTVSDELPALLAAGRVEPGRLAPPP